MVDFLALDEWGSALRWTLLAQNEAEDDESLKRITVLESVGRVRRHAAEALGTTSQLTSAGVAALANVLTHEDEFLRRNAAIALARIGSRAKDATRELTAALNDDDRYVRGKAAHALRRIGTPEAHDALFHYLTTSQYCYSTTKDSMY